MAYEFDSKNYWAAKCEAAEAEVARLTRALNAATTELFEAEDKFWVYACNHPKSPDREAMEKSMARAGYAANAATAAIAKNNGD